MQFKKRFDQKYKNSPDLFGTEPIPILKDSLNFISSGEVLELGVGNGRNTLYLLSKSFKVTGVDISPEGIKILQQRTSANPNLNLIVSDVLTFKPDKKFDLIIAIGLLHFLNSKQISLLIQKMKSWTKKDGFNVIGARMTQNFRQDLPHVFQHQELKNLYQEGNWAIKKYQENQRGNSQIASLIAQKTG